MVLEILPPKAGKEKEGLDHEYVLISWFGPL